MTERRLPKTAVENLVEDLASKANADLSNLDATGQAVLDAKANVDLSNLDATGQAKFDAKANVDLDNLSAAGQAILNGKANVDLNNLSTAGQAILNGKADINLSNLNNTGNAAASNLNSKGIRTVIETYVNGTSWYRVWSDGWCEQGGSQNFPSGATTLNLLIHVNVLCAGGIRATLQQAGAQTNPMIGIINNGTQIQVNTGSGGSEYFFWKVEGYKQ